MAAQRTGRFLRRGRDFLRISGVLPPGAPGWARLPGRASDGGAPDPSAPTPAGRRAPGVPARPPAPQAAPRPRGRGGRADDVRAGPGDLRGRVRVLLPGGVGAPGRGPAAPVPRRDAGELRPRVLAGSRSLPGPGGHPRAVDAEPGPRGTSRLLRGVSPGHLSVSVATRTLLLGHVGSGWIWLDLFLPSPEHMCREGGTWI